MQAPQRQHKARTRSFHIPSLSDGSGRKLKYDQKRKQHDSVSIEGFQLCKGKKKARGRGEKGGGKPEGGDVSECKRECEWKSTFPSRLCRRLESYHSQGDIFMLINNAVSKRASLLCKECEKSQLMLSVGYSHDTQDTIQLSRGSLCLCVQLSLCEEEFAGKSHKHTHTTTYVSHLHLHIHPHTASSPTHMQSHMHTVTHTLLSST